MTNENVHARAATRADLPVLMELWNAFIAEQQQAAWCENELEPDEVRDAIDARFDWCVDAGLVVLLETADGSVFGFVAGLDHAADARVPADALLVTELYVHPDHRAGARNYPSWPRLQQQARAAGKTRLLANTHEGNRGVILIMRRLGFVAADALPFDVPGHSWWEKPL